MRSAWWLARKLPGAPHLRGRAASPGLGSSAVRVCPLAPNSRCPSVSLENAADTRDASPVQVSGALPESTPDAARPAFLSRPVSNEGKQSSGHSPGPWEVRDNLSEWLRKRRGGGGALGGPATPPSLPRGQALSDGVRRPPWRLGQWRVHLYPALLPGDGGARPEEAATSVPSVTRSLTRPRGDEKGGLGRTPIPTALRPLAKHHGHGRMRPAWGRAGPHRLLPGALQACCCLLLVASSCRGAPCAHTSPLLRLGSPSFSF